MGVLPDGLERVLLIHPPVYDVRFPWPHWQQPTWLLRLASYYRASGADLRLIDALHTRPRDRLSRKLLGYVTEDGIRLRKWRYGLPQRAIVAALEAFRSAGWLPDRVYIQCFTTFWWEGAVEAIRAVWDCMPDAPVTLVGPCASVIREESLGKYGSVDVLEEAPEELVGLANDLEVCPSPPRLLYVSFDGGRRTPASVVRELTAARKGGVRHVAFAGHGTVLSKLDQFREVLDMLAAAALGVNLYALGIFRPGDLVADKGLPGLMRQAGYTAIYFADDRDGAVDGSDDDALVDSYRQAAALCHRAGYRPRTGCLTGGVCVGRPGEDLGARARLTALVAHHIGAVIPWPYQPLPEECSGHPLESQNGKLFPLREANRLAYADYTNFLGFAALLNAKYRNCTFDFLGDGLIPILFRDSLARRAWEPPEQVKGPLRLPVLQQP